MTFNEFFSRVWEMLIGRTEGPLTLRLILQPTIATILAIRSGFKDAREERPPYFVWTVFTNPARRPELLKHARKDLRVVFIAAILLDVTYEIIVYRWVYPLQAVIVAIVLAIVPYVLIRGPVARIVSRLRGA